MFKNLMVYRLPAQWKIDPVELNNALARLPLRPCASLERETRGFVSPTDDDRFLYSSAGHYLFKLGQEQKILPQAVVNQYALEKVQKLESERGIKLGKKQMRDLKDDVADELLPRALVKRSSASAWIDSHNQWLIVDAGSPGKADDLVTQFRRAANDIELTPIDTERAPGSAMTSWLAAQAAPTGFTLDRDCELRTVDEDKATVRYVRHSLEGDEIREHIAQGKFATRLALTWSNRVSLVLTDTGAIKRIKFEEILDDDRPSQAEDKLMAFEQNFALMTGELSEMLADLYVALGGVKGQ